MPKGTTPAVAEAQRNGVGGPRDPAAGRADGPAETRNRFQHAYDGLRSAIEDGTLQPGRRLTETQVSDWLQVSRTPTREALRRLLAEGLLEYGAAGGLAVAVHDAVAVRELYAVREALEGSAAGMAARHAELHEIELLQEQVRLQARLPPDVRVHDRENRLFHEGIYRASHNRFLLKSVQALQDAMVLLGKRNFAVPGRIEASTAEHAAIVEAIAARNPARAEEAARLHIQHGYDSRLRAMTEAFRSAAAERTGTTAAGPGDGPGAGIVKPTRPTGRTRPGRAPAPRG